MALSQHFEGGLTDIEMANGLNVYDFDDTFEDERAFEMEYEVSFHKEKRHSKISERILLSFGVKIENSRGINLQGTAERSHRFCPRKSSAAMRVQQDVDGSTS